ncbi:MAG: TetR/AcrR family transcriptional regulator [Cyanophyceae cyanobacterium]
MVLQRQDWIEESWKVIATQSVEAVKVEAIARQLGVSKGSFYWHFKNRAELLDALLKYWQQDTLRLIQESRKAPTAKESLMWLFNLIDQTNQQFSADTAIFLWAKKNAGVAQRVREVESKRIQYLQELLQGCGLNWQEAAHRAEVAYLAFLGYADRRHRDSQFSLSIKEFSHFLLSMLIAPSTSPSLNGNADGAATVGANYEDQ